MKKLILALLISFLIPGLLSAGEREDFAIAQEAYKKGLFQETASYLEKFIADYPKSKNADYGYLLSGIAYLKIKKPEKAISEFQSVLSRYPETHYREIITYYLGASFYEADRGKEAEKIFQKFLEEYPRSKYLESVYYALVLSTLQGAELPQAEEWLASLEKFYPQSELIKSGKKMIAYKYYQRALGYYQKENYPDALNDFQKTISFTREEILLSNSFLKIGDIFFNQKKYQEAEDEYQRVISDFPESMAASFALFQLGTLYEKKRDFKEARTLFRKILARFPESTLIPDCFYEIGLSFFREEDYCLARENFEKVIKEYPGAELAKSALLQKALCDYNGKEYQKALDAFQEFINKYPNHQLIGEAYYGTGNLLSQLGRKKEAKEIWAKGLQTKPASPLTPEFNLLIARGYFEEGEFGQAKIRLREILERFPENSAVPEALYLLGLCSLKEKKKEEAMSYFDRFLAFYPQDSLTAAVAIEKGNLLINQEEWEKAMEVLKKIPKENRVLYAESLFKIGDCLQNLKRPKDALHSYLEVSTFYNDISPWNKKAEEAIIALKKILSN